MASDEQAYMQAQIRENMLLKETDELLEIWREADHEEWTDLALEVVKKIVVERLGEIPAPEKEDVKVSPQPVESKQAPASGEIQKFLRQQTYENMDGLSTEELIDIWQQADHEQWTDLAFEVIQQILMERIGRVPAQQPPEPAVEEPDEEDEEEDQAETAEPRAVLPVEPPGEGLHLPDIFGSLFGLRCPDCGKGISEQDRVCPHCGVDLEAPLDETELQALAAEVLDKAQKKFDHGRDFKGALEDCDLALEYAPDSAPAHNLRGMILDALDRRSQAVQEYKQAVRLDPGLADARDNLAESEAELQSPELAAELTCSDCGSPVSEQDKVCKNCGALLEELPEDLPVEAEPASPATVLLEKAGKYLDEDHDLQDALAFCDRALEYTPNSAQAHNLRGLILDGLGKTGLAVEEYRTALRLDPGLTDARDNLKDAETDLGTRDF